MKRELAALMIKSPVLIDSIGRTTRSSKRFRSGENSKLTIVDVNGVEVSNTIINELHQPLPNIVSLDSRNAEVVSSIDDNVQECIVNDTIDTNLGMKVPTTMQDLFETGFLEGCPVYYDADNAEGTKLRGRIKGIGILCSCDLCKGSQVISPSMFEIHACNKYRRAVQYIYLENGRSLINILKTCKSTRLNTLEATVRNAIGPLPEKKSIICQNCKGSFSSMDVESTEAMCTTCVMLNLSPIGPAYSTRKRYRDLQLHKLIFEDDALPEGTELGYYRSGQKLLGGFKKGSGISCNCCESVVSASQFAAHAGCASRGNPYSYIYTSNGVSLHELSVTLIKDRPHSAMYSDDLCSICADGGNLLLCDGCPRAFHKGVIPELLNLNHKACKFASGNYEVSKKSCECVSLASIPHGKWYCKYCKNMFEREKFVAHNANAVAAGRISGVDCIEQINKQSIQIVNNLASEVGACILCRGHDFCKSGFGPRTIILCNQCQKEYHVGCLKDHNMAHLTELPDGKWFCSMECGRNASMLENHLVPVVEKLPESFVMVVQKKNMQNASDSGMDWNVNWSLLCGKIAWRLRMLS